MVLLHHCWERKNLFLPPGAGCQHSLSWERSKVQ